MPTKKSFLVLFFRKERAFFLACFLLAAPVLAAPPVVGSEDWQVLAPHAGWVTGLRRDGISCCDMADGRPVEARSRGEGWQVRFRPGQLDGAPTDWVDVPAAAVIRGENPVGLPVAFWHGGQVRCFVPGSTF